MKKEENLEKQVKELEKSNRWMKGILLAFVGIFFMFLCVGFGYVLGKDNSKSDGVKDIDETKEEKNDETEEVEVENLTVDSPVVKKLFSLFNESRWDRHELLKEIDKAENKRAIAYYNLMVDFKDDKEIKCSELEKWNYSWKVNGEETEFSCSFGWDDKDATTTSFDAKYLKEEYETMFGLNSGYNADHFVVKGSLFYYDKTKNIYARLFGVYGDETADYKHELISIEQEGTGLKLNTVLTSEYDSSINTSIVYTFELEKETGNYIFVNRTVKE